MPTGDIGHLLCGSDSKEGVARIAFDRLSHSINSFSAKAIQYLNEDAPEDALIFGPFCARVLLENACAALVGRLDSFRVLYLSEFQTKSQYVAGERAKSAFSWLGDVIPDNKSVTDLWNLNHDISKISRALFSVHLDHLYWKPAVVQMLDFVACRESDDALTDIRQFNAETYISMVKGRSLRLYSTLSKGIHWEFFTSGPHFFDESTVKESIRETCLLVSHLGLTSHFIPTAYASLSPSEAVELYCSFRKDVP